MANYLNILLSPQFKFETQFEVMRDYRKGGLNPANYADVIEDIRQLPPISKLSYNDLDAIAVKYKLTDISGEDLIVIQREVRKRNVEKSKICYHPEASIKTCDTDSKGRIKVSAAHSIQNNGVLSKIADEGHVMGVDFESPEYDGAKVGKRLASIFWGFCNKHDAIFKPIENEPYTGTDEQHFLFAYRALTIAAHKKVEASHFIDFGEQSEIDIKENRRIANQVLLNKDYQRMTTHVFETPNFYPIAVSSAFYLDFDYESNPILHSKNRMEMIFVTLFPTENKTIFLLSYFKEDAEVYQKVPEQIRTREQFQLDISILLAPHAENIFFNPTYYNTFIEDQEDRIAEIFVEAQFDIAEIGDDDNLSNLQSLTPKNYLNNRLKINLFGY